MKTSSFFTYRGPGRVGISVGRPRGFREDCQFYPKLAPRRNMLDLGYDEYREIYFREILGPLDPNQVAKDLHLLTGGVEPVMLCFEKPPLTADNWCHRRLVAEWFQTALSIEVPEVAQDQMNMFER